MEKSKTETNHFPGSLPPDIIQSTLPFLDREDIENLSLTNKYYHKLLNFNESQTLWHELFHKAYGTLYTNDEPFRTKNSEKFKTCSEAIMLNAFPNVSWNELFKLRSKDAKLYTWGCLKHARLGYTAVSNPAVTEDDLNGTSTRFKFGVNKPIEVPWFSNGENSELVTTTADDDSSDSIVQISGGGYSFQILTRSGKLYSTGPTYSGSHRGPGPENNEEDFNPFREAIQSVEHSWPRVNITRGPTTSINTTGTFHPPTPHHYGPTPTPTQQTNHSPIGRQDEVIETIGPHRNIYDELQTMENFATELVPGNKHIRRMFTRHSFPVYSNNPPSFKIDKEVLGSIKFIGITSGRSHFLALDTENELYSWDNPSTEHGVKVIFDGLPSKETNPILKIACGWDFNCVFIYDVGLVVWKSRKALKRGELYSKANYFIIPNTSSISGDDKVIDFTCTEDSHVFYIDYKGDTLYEYKKLGIVNKVTLPTDKVKGKLVKVISCLSKLVVFTDQNLCYSMHVQDGSCEMNSLTELALEDPEDRILSLSGGDYHILAVTEQGKLYVWGVESQYSGCLGLGRPQHIVNDLHIGTWNGERNVKVLKPTKIELEKDYICVGVAAGGWQSAALIIKRDS
ncbi:SCF ubiquitin ligase complex subunit SAF1 NDAI_0B04870 [Naumovozyma dairenensis CBS 421]|uniref:F-box domain-containing protein n=1 Tax=Naumovozyma dairenensis (strain ATCC 10597 / BCRC 20456 / CBS 421 / NBRC 0211 / NRRL Y-12639) TaxID=1071378 RepID=G0W6W0_NAUDC|nr:hypothetical protein NDAI_0B04870 [Naumovozyma dairenensis CBS 421]CCD23521.1 hypothetical protein NDAI_0B04870 [Naumovozyma dairenensis CBS 421]